MKIFVKFPLFNAPLWVYVGEDQIQRVLKDARRHFPIEGDAEDFDGCEGRCLGSFIWLKAAKVGTLAHELNHAIDAMLEHRGVKDESGEVKSYCLSWGMEKIWGKIIAAGEKTP